MLNNNYTEKLLGLEEAIAEKIEFIDETCVVHITMQQRIHQCPECSTHTSKVHDYRIQRVKHIPIGNTPVILSIRKRRHVCPCCGKRFFETIPFLPKYQRTSNALWAMALLELSKTASMKSIAERLNVSASTIARILDKVNYPCATLPPVISIDEFKGNTGGRKFQCILTNPKEKKVLDILPNRKSDDLYQYFSKFPDRNNVKYVVMDLSTLFRSLAKTAFPKAEIVADRFHALRLAIYALEQVRKEVQKNFHTKRRKYFKHARTLLIKHKEKLDSEELEQVANMLSLSKELAQAYHLKELAYGLFASPDVYTAKKKLLAFKMAVQVANLAPFNKVASTYTQWEKEILNAFDVPFSNGYTEGCNNRIKVTKRVAYGMRNYERFKKRILHTMAQY